MAGLSSARPSRLQLPPGHWDTVLACLCERLPGVSAEEWRERMRQGRVTTATGDRLDVAAAYRAGLEVRYFREVQAEPPIPGDVVVVHEDTDLLVVDKPHFLPVAPTGRFVEQTVLSRLQRARPHDDLAPLHRLDAATAGLVMFSRSLETRGAYQALFRERSIHKVYEALAPALRSTAFPHVRRSCLVRGEPFFRVREVDAAANSETCMDIDGQCRDADIWRYRLAPVSGRKHQLRVHMAALGAPIVGDAWYPTVTSAPGVQDFDAPLQLLARTLSFDDPLSGIRRTFHSARVLACPRSAR